jgi:hypothetical protein
MRISVAARQAEYRQIADLGGVARRAAPVPDRSPAQCRTHPRTGGRIGGQAVSWCGSSLSCRAGRRTTTQFVRIRAPRTASRISLPRTRSRLPTRASRSQPMCCAVRPSRTCIPCTDQTTSPSRATSRCRWCRVNAPIIRTIALIWFTHGEVNGVDFWTEGAGRGVIVHRGLERVGVGSCAGALGRSQPVADCLTANLMLDETTEVICYAAPDSRWLDYTVALTALDADVKFGDTKEGTFGVRVASSMEVARNAGGQIVNANGQRDREAWGKRAPWCDYTGIVEGDTVGIAIFDHPCEPAPPNLLACARLRAVRRQSVWRPRLRGRQTQRRRATTRSKRARRSPSAIDSGCTRGVQRRRASHASTRRTVPHPPSSGGRRWRGD